MAAKIFLKNMEHNLIKILDNVEIGHEENLILLNNDVYFFVLSYQFYYSFH